MQKRKFFTILSILIIISLIGVSAQCGVDSGDKIGISEEEAATDETPTDSGGKDTSDSEGEEDSEGEAGEADSEEEADEADSEGDDAYLEMEAPTISLAIYEGPTLSGSICYYRIEATITGSPNPTVSFSKDDSGGSWGSKKVQINLNNPTDTYTLIATATNSEGSASDSITLDWGCEEPEPDPDEGSPNKEPPPEEPITTSLDLVTDLSGSVGWELEAIHDYIVIGDNEDNESLRGILSFDISGLRVETIDSATLTITTIWNTPGNITEMGPLGIQWIKTSHGDRLVDEDYILTSCGVVAEHETTGGLFSINESGDLLTWAIQSAIDLGWDNFQLEFYLHYRSTNNREDQLRFDFDYVDLTVVY